MKKTISIFALFVILAVSYLLQEARVPQHNESAGYHRILSGEFKPSEVTTILFYPPGKRGEGVVISRDTGKDGEWRITSRFNAPAETSRVVKLLRQIETMEGEERADDPSLLGRFSLEDEKSYQLVLSGEKGELYHLLVGKRSETPTYGFLRLKGENRVFLADREFRHEFGIKGEGVTSLPDQISWVNKRIISLKRADLERVTYEDKEGRIVFERKREEGAGSEKSEKKGGPHDQPQEEWLMVSDSGNSRKEVQWDTIRPLVASIVSLGGSNIIDPAKREELGLKEPAVSVTVVTKGETQRVFLGSPKGGKGEKFYVSKDGSELLYEIYPSTKEGVFDRFKEVAEKLK